MNQLKELDHCATAFWDPIPKKNRFPRDLEEHLSIYYPASIEPITRMTVNSVHGWLSTHGYASCPSCASDQRLDGCIVANQGHAFLFIDNALPRDERRMIVAHETAHYWHDYEMPRRRMGKRFGKDGLHLLDNPISGIDLLMASASGVPIQAYYHYHQKDAHLESEVERRANTLTCLFIAPLSSVMDKAAKDGVAWDDDSRWLAMLQHSFGIPQRWAVGYLPLLPRKPVSPSFSSWFLPASRTGVTHDV